MRSTTRAVRIVGESASVRGEPDHRGSIDSFPPNVTTPETDTPPPLVRLSASELARRIAAGEVTATDVVEAHIGRLAAIQESLNCVAVPLYEQAREVARRADQRRARGEELGPLHGVPFTAKECFDVAGSPTTAGVPSLADHRAAATSPLLQRWLDAGAILTAKTNVPELLIYIETDNPLYGRTLNPWSPERAPNGSSGGEAAAIAALGSPLGLGTDIGGSVRLPAHACGICGLKPTAGRLPLAGMFTPFPGQEGVLDAAGPLARSVADLALGMRVLGSPASGEDPSTSPVPLGDPRRVRLDALRVGYYLDDGFIRPAPALRRVVEEAARALDARGTVVEEFSPPDTEEAMRLLYSLLSADGAAWARPLLAGRGHDRRAKEPARMSALPRPVRSVLTAGLRLAGQPRMARTLSWLGRRSVEEYWRLLAQRNAYRGRFLEAMRANRLDALLCPPSAHPALRHGAGRELTAAASYTMTYNVLGWPAGVVAASRVRPDEECDRPASRDLVERAARRVETDSAGLPIGVQVVGLPWREDVVLAVMEALEEHFRGQPDYPDFGG